MSDYKDSKIYKITCNVSGLTYYGSTTQPISKRMVQHRADLKRTIEKRLCNSKLVLAAGNYDYCLVEKFPCDDKSELHRRERFYIESNECVNTSIPGRTQSEYKSENKEKISKQQKEYRDDNKEKISIRHKGWYSENKDEFNAKRSVKITCECGCKIRKSYIARHRKCPKHIDRMSQI